MYFSPIRRNSVSKSSLKVFEQGRGHLNRCSGQGALCQFPARKLWWLLEGISSVVHIRADLKNRRQLDRFTTSEDEKMRHEERDTSRLQEVQVPQTWSGQSI